MSFRATLSVSALTAILSLPAVAAEAPKHPVRPGPVASPELVAEIAAADRALFASVFDTCDMAALAALVADDFEFFHDKHGKTASSGAEFVESIRKSCALKADGTNIAARRELVEGSFEVYAMADDGAIEVGTHRFYGLEPGKPDQLRETGQFFQLWKKDGGRWKLTRVFSYDHRAATP